MFLGGYYGVYRAQMDGSGLTTLVHGLKVSGIVVDPGSDRLYFTYNTLGQIVSSFRNGSGIETIALLKLIVQFGKTVQVRGAWHYWAGLYTGVTGRPGLCSAVQLPARTLLQFTEAQPAFSS